MEENQVTVNATLRGMEIGGMATYPIVKMKSIRVQATELGVILSRKYKTALNRKAGTITVTRVL